MKEGGTGFVLMCLDLLHVCKGSKDKGFIKGNRISVVAEQCKYSLLYIWGWSSLFLKFTEVYFVAPKRVIQVHTA